jgi:hypothetical protein
VFAVNSVGPTLQCTSRPSFDQWMKSAPSALIRVTGSGPPFSSTETSWVPGISGMTKASKFWRKARFWPSGETWKSLTRSPSAWMRRAWPLRSVLTSWRLPRSPDSMKTRSLDAAN